MQQVTHHQMFALSRGCCAFLFARSSRRKFCTVSGGGGEDKEMRSHICKINLLHSANYFNAHFLYSLRLPLTACGLISMERSSRRSNPVWRVWSLHSALMKCLCFALLQCQTCKILTWKCDPLIAEKKNHLPATLTTNVSSDFLLATHMIKDASQGLLVSCNVRWLAHVI